MGNFERAKFSRKELKNRPFSNIFWYTLAESNFNWTFITLPVITFYVKTTKQAFYLLKYFGNLIKLCFAKKYQFLQLVPENLPQFCKFEFLSMKNEFWLYYRITSLILQPLGLIYHSLEFKLRKLLSVHSPKNKIYKVFRPNFLNCMPESN